ncbi:hypothetical protein [Thiorhodospira sibirica]|uniref:hypothetical protein n=1 Tax=Thiorhodospira sibirica TaxID=154347 RepID=UPI00022C1D2B|nr:hypothetical protein [Thiorhodospira sibirica]
MTIEQLIPSVNSLSHAEKIRLMQIVLEQLVQDDGTTERARERFDPKRFYGLAHQSRQAVDQYLAEAREGWRE